MKKSILLVLAVFAIFTAYSQSAPGKWMIKKYGVNFGAEQDMIRNMDADYMLNSAKGTENSVFRKNGMRSEDLYSGVCENPHVHITATLGIPGEDRFNLEVGVYGVFNRYDGLYYSNNNYYYDEYFGDYNSQDANNDYIYMDAISHEMSLEAIFNRQVNVARWFKLYGGLGTNAGFSFGDDLTIGGTTEKAMTQSENRTTLDIVTGETFKESEYFNEVYELRDGFSQRVFASAGLGVILFKRLELGLNFTRGIGYRSHFGGGTKMLNLHSAGFRVHWLMKR